MEYESGCGCVELCVQFVGEFRCERFLAGFDVDVAVKVVVRMEARADPSGQFANVLDSCLSVKTMGKSGRTSETDKRSLQDLFYYA